MKIFKKKMKKKIKAQGVSHEEKNSNTRLYFQELINIIADWIEFLLKFFWLCRMSKISIVKWHLLNSFFSFNALIYFFLFNKIKLGCINYITKLHTCYLVRMHLSHKKTIFLIIFSSQLFIFQDLEDFLM